MPTPLPIFYAPPEDLSGDAVVLRGDEAHHALRVLRLGIGDRLLVIDGLGAARRGEIVEAGARGATVTVRVRDTIRNFGEPAVRLTLAAGLSAGAKFDAVVQRGTELGVQRFVPILGEKSKVRMEDAGRAAARVRRLEKVALAAVKQCRRSYSPEIALPTGLESFLAYTDPEALNLVFHAAPGGKPLSAQAIPPGVSRVSLLVGPEAGFSEAEAGRAIAAGYAPISLGPRILRSETAGPVVCALVMHALGELS
ncbi:MAG TPA: RsmE family RNA methyltransferase [candidate division Zixibacteria bacterium]|nr:RsmE family RNA methyltransferase [candidate division Zixibacteria bacterium]